MARTVLGFMLLVIIIIYKYRRRNFVDEIEEFLELHKELMPIRYSYREIKKITNHFQEKLGEGGFGSVYKGKLRSGHLVAVNY